MAKRPRDAFDTTPSSSPPMPPPKRMATDTTTLRSTFPMPRSPWAFSVPHDSPSNPFGLDRSLRSLALPRPSGFGKHIVLRMQFVSLIESRHRSRRSAPEAPYRIVQVPLNYSFRLLHELILFLFASDSRLRVRRPRRVFSPSLYPHQPPPPPRKPKKEVFGESPKKDEGHLFEVMNDVQVYASTYRPGVIKPGTGKLYARLSSTRERKLFRTGTRGRDDDDDDDVFGDTTAKPPVEEEEDEEEWDWEAEDDFLLSSVWTDGPDLKKGIVYHHTESTGIHITVNQVRVPPRKGTGNTPFVFSALGGSHGAVRIANIVSGPMPSEDEIKENMEDQQPGPRKGKSKSSKETGRTIRDLLVLTDDDFDEVDELDDGEAADDDQLERWNAPGSFHRFLAREAARERAMRRTAELERDVLQSPAPATRANKLLPGSPAGGSSTSLTHMYASREPQQPAYYAQPGAASSSTSLLSVAPSSPSTLPVLLPSSDFDGDAEAWSDLDFDTDPNPSSEADAESSSASASSSSLTRRHVYEIELPLQTPYPANPAVRRRVGRMCKRIERQTSKGLSELSDEEEDEEEQKDELVSSQESKASQEQQHGAQKAADTRSDATEDEPTARQPVPVVAARGPDLFAEVYGNEQDPGQEDDDLSDDEGWEQAPIVFDFDDDDDDDFFFGDEP